MRQPQKVCRRAGPTLRDLVFVSELLVGRFYVVPRAGQLRI